MKRREQNKETLKKTQLSKFTTHPQDHIFPSSHHHYRPIKIKKSISICKSQWQKYDCQKQLVPYLTVWLIESQLTMHDMNSLSLLHTVSFPLFRKLVLKGSMMVTTEKIHYLDSPLLEQLSLQNNKIVSISSIRKLRLCNLKTLNLSENPFYSSPKLQTLILDDPPGFKSNQTYNWMPKVNLPSLHMLYHPISIKRLQNADRLGHPQLQKLQILKAQQIFI